MRIAVNARLLYQKGIEGIGRYAIEVIQRISHQHREDEIHLIFDHKPDEVFKFGDNVYLHQVGWPARHPILWRLWFEFSFKRIIDKIQPDVIFSPESYMSLGVDAPTVITTHDLAFEHYPEYNKRAHLKYLKHWFPLFHQKAKKVICVSKFTQEDVIQQYGLAQTQTRVIYNGVAHIEDYSQSQIAEFKDEHSLEAPYFLYLGAIHPRKNIVNLIRAFDHFKAHSNSSHKLVLAGRLAWSYSDVKVAIAESAYQSDIIQLGFFDGDKNLLLAGAEALCYVSLFEGFGLPLLEAMRVGTPVITAQVSSMPEIAAEAALYVDPSDIVNISSAMGQLVRSSSLRQKLIVNGYERVKDFNWQSTAEQVYQVLKEASHT